jgi:thiamine phosphate synthase YjbQ (UPF0047 family)
VAGCVELRLRTARTIERRDITEDVRQAAAKLGARDGALLVSLPHTDRGRSPSERPGIPT